MINRKHLYMAFLLLITIVFLSCNRETLDSLFVKIASSGNTAQFSDIKKYLKLSKKTGIGTVNSTSYNHFMDVYVKLLVSYPENRLEYRPEMYHLKDGYDSMIEYLVQKQEYKNAIHVCKLALQDGLLKNSAYNVWFGCAVKLQDFTLADSLFSNSIQKNGEGFASNFDQKEVLRFYESYSKTKYENYKRLYISNKETPLWAGIYTSNTYREEKSSFDYQMMTPTFYTNFTTYTVSLNADKTATVDVRLLTYYVNEYDSGSAPLDSPTINCKWRFSNDFSKCIVTKIVDGKDLLEIRKDGKHYKLHSIPLNTWLEVNKKGDQQSSDLGN